MTGVIGDSAGPDALLPRGEVWLVRHAETEWSKTGRHTGRTDISLTDTGRAAACALAPRLAGHAFAQVRVSPLGRARETATLAGVDLDAAGVVVDDDLQEWDYGDYEGLTTPEIREDRPGWVLWNDGVPGGEDADDIAARVDRVLVEVCAVDGDVLLVAHGHLLRVLGARWLAQPPTFGARLILDPGGICVLGQERGRRAVRRWNS
ncbi:MAG: histidine phosphatase family protein [Solirubrobacterales bacterium]|nr:histidine phosphatase family protein [Solirubrobacterales bacterium]